MDDDRKVRKVRVLVVDDNERSRGALVALLSTEPAVAVLGTAADGQEALASVERELPDVVVMDVRMPVLDGIEATRRIKVGWPSVRVVVLTVMPAYHREALTAGADRFLVKGGPAEELIEAVLGRVPSPHAPAPPPTPSDASRHWSGFQLPH